MHVCILLSMYMHGYYQVFKAQRKGNLEDEVFAAKRITIKDSDQFDTQAEVIISLTLMRISIFVS